MSAFVVEDKTINRVVSFLLYDRDARDYIERRLNQAGISLPDLGRRMFELNCTAVNARYGASQAQEFRDLDYSAATEICSRVQALKSLQCWLYQCAEGEVPETDLYKIMERYAADIAMSLIRYRSDYEAAEWG